jgi:ATP-dependent protease Clp ATPase subunit
MCKKALKSGQGVRSLKRELDKMFIDKEFDFEDREEMKQLTGCWTEKLI